MAYLLWQGTLKKHFRNTWTFMVPVAKQSEHQGDSMYHIRTRDKKAMAEQYAEGYDEDMIDDLKTIIWDYLDGQEAQDVDAMEIHEIVEKWRADMPEVFDYAFDKVESVIDDIGDQRMEEERERNW